MIHLPRRSVTRFFIPLIDVLLLLFCVFLLMPMVAEEGLEVEERERETAKQLLNKKIAELELALKDREAIIESKGIGGRIAELEKERDRLKEELESLKKLASAPVQDRLFMRVIDIDSRTGVVSFYDATRMGKERTFEVADRKAAEYLVEKHRNQAGTRELYYFFYYPGDGGFPTLEQVKELGEWFRGVPSNLTRTDEEKKR